MVACAAEEPEQENQLRKPRCCSNFAAEDSLALFVRDAENHTAVAPMSGLSSGKRDSLEQASDVCVVPDAGAASTSGSARRLVELHGRHARRCLAGGAAANQEGG